MKSLQKYKKKVVLFAPSIEDGGVEKNLAIIANYLKDKFDVSILTSNNNKKKIFNKKINFICPKTNFFNNKQSPSGYKFVCLNTLFTEEKIFFGISNGDSFDESFINLLLFFSGESPGIYFAIPLIEGLTIFSILNLAIGV